MPRMKIGMHCYCACVLNERGKNRQVIVGAQEILHVAMECCVRNHFTSPEKTCFVFLIFYEHETRQYFHTIIIIVAVIVIIVNL